MKAVALEMHVTASTREHSQSKLLDLLFQYSSDVGSTTLAAGNATMAAEGAGFSGGDVPIQSLSEAGRGSRMRILAILDAVDFASLPPPNITLELFDREKVGDSGGDSGGGSGVAVGDGLVSRPVVCQGSAM